MLKYFLYITSIFSIISCSKNAYEFQIKNESNYEMISMKLGEVENIMLDANGTSNTISIETGTLQEGIGVSVLEFKHMSPDSIKLYINTFGKFYTLSALKESELNEIHVKVNFNKQSVYENDFIEIELKN